MNDILYCAQLIREFVISGINRLWLHAEKMPSLCVCESFNVNNRFVFHREIKNDV